MKEVVSHVFEIGGIHHHLIGDSGELRNPRRNLAARIHQSLKILRNDAVPDFHHGDLRDPMATVGGTSSGFHIHDGIPETLQFLFRNGSLPGQGPAAAAIHLESRVRPEKREDRSGSGSCIAG